METSDPPPTGGDSAWILEQRFCLSLMESDNPGSYESYSAVGWTGLKPHLGVRERVILHFGGYGIHGTDNFK